MNVVTWIERVNKRRRRKRKRNGMKYDEVKLVSRKNKRWKETLPIKRMEKQTGFQNEAWGMENIGAAPVSGVAEN